MASLERARANAESNRLLAESVTADVIRLRSLEKWNGKMPLVASNTPALLDLSDLK